QNNLGLVYRERLQGNRVVNLEQAIAALEAAIAVRTREALPAEWAATQYNLGLALTALAEERNDTETLLRARECFQAATDGLTSAGLEEAAAEAAEMLRRVEATLDAGV